MIKLSFSISEVADIVGVVPATIRNWEKKGLIQPTREENNYRSFSMEDIEDLKRIKTYIHEHKIGLDAVKNLMTTQNADYNPISIIAKNEDNHLLSEKWRAKRLALDYTLEEVSKMTGISSSYISKIENGKANISLKIMNVLADFYGENILHFVNIKQVAERVVRKGTEEKVDIGLEGVTIHSLASDRQNTLFPVTYEIKPNSGSAKVHKHEGEEFVFVLNGQLELKLENEIFVLSKGDSIIFRSSETHSWKNPGKTTTNLLWIYTPVSL